MPITRWDDLYASRLDWAEHAYATFLHSIDEEVARDFERKGEITVVLYGRTQVGKTTLLLKVLGIADDYYAHVSHTLRGGRELGHSATATATRYARSPDSYWHIGSNQSPPLDGRALEQQLAEIRKRVEAGRYDTDSPLNVWIPRQYFVQQASSIEVRILDLPGTHSVNINEQKHVARVAERFVPAADVVLLVGKANALGFLKPEELGFEELQYWPHSPDRFKIILTHTYSDQSTKDWIAEQGGCDTNSIRQKMLEQLRTHDSNLPDKLVNSLFPVEFGGSWDALRSTRDPVFQHAEPVVARLISDLTKSVLESATKYARIRSAFNIHAAIKERRRSDAEKLEARKLTLVATAELEQRRLEALNTEISRQKKEIEAIRKSLRKLTDAGKKGQEAISTIISSGTKGISKTAKEVVAITEFIAEEKGRLSIQWEELRNEINLDGASAELGEYPYSHVNHCFSDIMSILMSYSGPFSNKYLWLDNYLSDREKALKAQALAVTSLRSNAKDQLKQLISKEAARIDRKEKKACNQQSELQSNHRSLMERAQTAEHQVLEADTQIRAFTDESKARELRAQPFEKHLHSAFGCELEAQLKCISAASNPVEKFSRLCFTVLLTDDYQKLGS